MKTKNFLSQSGGKPDVTRRQNRNRLGSVISRLSLGSIVSRFSLVSLICVLMLTLGIGNAWGGATTYTFNSTSWGGATGWSSTKSASTTDATKGVGVYKAASGAGAETSSSISNITKVQIALSKSSNGKGTVTVKVGSTTVITQNSFSTSVTTYSSSDLSNLSGKVSFTVTCTTSTIYVKSVTITTGSGTVTYTLKVSNGLGGYTTYSNKVKSDLTEATAMGGNDCAGGLAGYYSGWRVGSLETPAASPGTTYNHATPGDMPASGSTLYAVYANNSGKYLTNPLCEETCSNTVTPAAGTKTNVTTIAFDKASVETCSETASDRQVTVTITPASCYAVPSSTRLTVTGTSASYVSGPADNGNGTYSFVYQFAQNATSTSTFAASLGTKTTYTVSYNKGTYGTGNNSSATKTCGTALVLPNTAMFTRTGYTQTGWSTAQAGTSKNYNLGGSYTTDAATTLYPYWEANQYTVTWKVNNTNYSAGGQANVNHGSHVTTLPTAPNPASYCGQRFMGWTTSEVVTPQAAAPSPLYTEASQFPNATGNQVFHAVFADYDD